MDRKLYECFKFYLNTTNILRTPVELQKLVQQLLARLTGGSSALYRRHTFSAPTLTVTTACDKQLQMHKHVQFNVYVHVRAEAPTHGDGMMEEGWYLYNYAVIPQ